MIPWWRPGAVSLSSTAPALEELAGAARSAALPAPAEARLALAERLGTQVPAPEEDPARLWSVLATLAAADLGVARTVEAHLDALAILAQAPDAPPSPSGRWGVFAAEGRGTHLAARETATGWRLDGDKPWCSLATLLDHALVTAHVEGGRRLFAVDLRDPGISAHDEPWAGRGLVEVPSTGLGFCDVPAVPVGGTDWYLTRPGFAWGGIGVAAVWLGGTVAVARTLAGSTLTREPDQVALSQLGAVDEAIQQAAAVLAQTAENIRSGTATAPRRLALLCRGVVARTAEEVLTRVGHATGPAPLTGDETHAKAVADLTVYLRQHHAERDQAALGRLVADAAAQDPA